MAFRCSLALLASLVLALVAVDMKAGASLGFRVSPRPGWGYWAKAALVLGVLLFVVLAATGAVVFGVLQYPIPSSLFTRTWEFGPAFIWMCVVSPLFEEVIYRLVVRPPAVAWLGPRGCILASGTIFAGLHVLYGSPSPDNLLGGFILARAFLKSGTLIVPIALHSLGNLGAFVAHVAHFYCQ